MHQQYRRLKDHEREEISRLLATGESQEAIASHLKRSPSSISREIERNKGKDGYRAFSASERARARAASRKSGKSRIAQEKQLREAVIAGLKKHWSPREIVESLKKEYPFDMTMRISHESIYRYIYVLPRGTLIKALRQEHKYRRKRKQGDHEENRGKIANMLSIEERPKEVEDRTIPGHWEGDLIVGKYRKTALGTLVERTTRYTILVPLKAKR